MTVISSSAVIGAAGYLGRHLVQRLTQLGRPPQQYGLHGDNSSGIRPLDVTRKADFQQLDPGLSQIYFFAGLTGTTTGFQDAERFLQVNQLGLMNLLHWMAQHGCRARILYPSTRLVYRGQAATPLDEDAPKEARSPYAVNKLAAEALLQAHAHAFDIDYTVFRICVPYGDLSGQGYAYGTIGAMLQRAGKGEPLTLYGDGALRRTFTHIEDLCTRILEAAAHPACMRQTFNIGGETLSLREVAAALAAHFNVPLQSIPWPDMAARLESGDTIFDAHRLDKLLKLPYQHNFHAWVNSLPRSEGN